MRISIATLLLWSTATLSACSLTHSEGNSSGSNWLRCQHVSDCATSEASSCSAQGYCLDDDGERIAALSGGASLTGNDANGGRKLGDASREGTNQQCAWGVEAILAADAVPASAPNPVDCGHFNYAASEATHSRALECFKRAHDAGRPVSITVNVCSGDPSCVVPNTYVAARDGRIFDVLEIEDDPNEEAMRRARLRGCEDLALVEEAQGKKLGCVNGTDLYLCDEPAGPVSAVKKWADAPNPDNGPTETVHLRIGNQTHERPWINIDIEIDGRRVVAGDAAVISQDNWFFIDLEVPRGTHQFQVHSYDIPDSGGPIELARDVDITGERWMLLAYYYKPGEDSAPYFVWE